MSLNFSFVFGNGLLVLICNPFAGLVSRANLRKTNRYEQQMVVAGPRRKTLRLQYLLLFIKVTSYVTTVLSSDLLSWQRS